MTSEIQKHLGDEAVRKIAAEASRQHRDLFSTEARDIFSARLRHELTKETHVVVGDHPPERAAFSPSDGLRWRDCPASEPR